MGLCDGLACEGENVLGGCCFGRMPADVTERLQFAALRITLIAAMFYQTMVLGISLFFFFCGM